MDRRDWELLDKQLQGSDLSRQNDGVPVLTVAAVFFSGMIIGGILFAPQTHSQCESPRTMRRLRWHVMTTVLAACGLMQYFSCTVGGLSR